MSQEANVPRTAAPMPNPMTSAPLANPILSPNQASTLVIHTV